MENDNSKAIISDLIFLAYADGKLTDSEYDFILQIALRLDLTEVEVQDLFDNPSSSRPIFTELERINNSRRYGYRIDDQRIRQQQAFR